MEYDSPEYVSPLLTNSQQNIIFADCSDLLDLNGTFKFSQDNILGSQDDNNNNNLDNVPSLRYSQVEKFTADYNEEKARELRPSQVSQELRAPKIELDAIPGPSNVRIKPEIYEEFIQVPYITLEIEDDIRKKGENFYYVVKKNIDTGLIDTLYCKSTIRDKGRIPVTLTLQNMPPGELRLLFKLQYDFSRKRNEQVQRCPNHQIEFAAELNREHLLRFDGFHDESSSAVEYENNESYLGFSFKTKERFVQLFISFACLTSCGLKQKFSLNVCCYKGGNMMCDTLLPVKVVANPHRDAQSQGRRSSHSAEEDRQIRIKSSPTLEENERKRKICIAKSHVLEQEVAKKQRLDQNCTFLTIMIPNRDAKNMLSYVGHYATSSLASFSALQWDRSTPIKHICDALGCPTSHGILIERGIHNLGGLCTLSNNDQRTVGLPSIELEKLMAVVCHWLSLETCRIYNESNP